MKVTGYFVPVVVMGTILHGCSNSSSTSPTANDPGSNPSVTTAEALYGTWISNCENDDEGTAYRYSEWSFDSTEVEAVTYNYTPLDNECATPTDSVRRNFEATYLADVQATSLGDAIKTDLIIKESIMMNGSEVIWDSNIDGIPADITNEYQIFLVKNNRLYAGDYESGDSSTEQTRPTIIDETTWLSKKR